MLQRFRLNQGAERSGNVHTMGKEGLSVEGKTARFPNTSEADQQRVPSKTFERSMCGHTPPPRGQTELQTDRIENITLPNFVGNQM